MRKHIKLIYLLTSVVILSFFSCVREKKDKYTDTLTEGVIQVAIDETFAPILEDEITVFESVTPKAGIVPIFTTEGNAIELLLKDSVRMAITTRPLSEKEIASLHARKFQPRLYRLASDAIALVVNNSNPDSLITVDQLRRILTGKITNWNQIFPNSKLGKIVTVFDNPNSSTVRYAIDSVCGGLSISTNLNAQTTNSEVLDYVARTPQALGLVGVNWLSNKVDTTNLSFKDVVKVMSVTNESVATVENSYKPFQAYLFYGYYPLTRNVYIILNDPRSALPSGFTSFLTAQRGQRVILKSGLVPATQPIRVVHVND